MSIIFDMREQKLFDMYKNKYPEHEPRIQQQNLEIGDIHICHTNPDFILVFERKSKHDLIASIKDGRYREQKLRMLHTYPSFHCSYILEGIPSWTDTTLETSVQGAIIYSMYRDKLHMVHVTNMEETIDFLKSVLSKVIDYPSKFVPQDMENVQYIEHVKVKKRKMENVDRITCYLLQWCQIPGISSKIAQEIVRMFPSWQKFYQDMANCANDTERIHILCKIPLVGHKKAQMIWQYLKDDMIE